MKSSSITIYFKSINGLKLSGGHFTQNREHVDKIVEAEIPQAVLREGFHNPVTEWIFLCSKMNYMSAINLVQKI